MPFVRQSDVVHNLFHLGLHFLVRQPLQTGVEPDVFLHRQPGLRQTNQIKPLPSAHECYKRAKKPVSVAAAYVHAEQYVVLGADAQILPDGAEFTADVLAVDIGCARCGWEQARQD